MSAKSIGLTDELHAYLVAHNGEIDDIVADLIAETRTALPDLAQMQVAPEQAAFLTFLARLINAQEAIEVGTFTGMSALAIARGLAPNGRLICLDVSTEFTTIAQRYWQRAGVADRIDLRIGPAITSLADLPEEPLFDLAFIDADKPGYPAYWEEIVPRMRAGGVIAVDNVLRHGRIIDREPDEGTAAMAGFNDLVSADTRVESVMLPLADGVTLARRLP